MSTIFFTCSVLANGLGVTPAPREVEYTGEKFVLDDYTRIITSPSLSEAGWFAVTQFQNTLAERQNFCLDATPNQIISDRSNTILIGNPNDYESVAARMKEYGLSISKEMDKEGYALGIGKDGIVVGAKNDAGILYGMISLKQIILSRSGDIYSGKIGLPGVKIMDWPAIGMRGIHDDVARGQVSTAEDYKEIIRSLAEFKMNTLMIYMEDLFRFKSYPGIGVGRGAFTKQEIDELEAFARNYNVQIIPIFQMLGHMANILTREGFLPLAEFPGSDCLRICDSTYEFLENCVKELADAFDSQYFHAGLDESWDMGRGRTRTLVKKTGSPEVHAQHYNKIYSLLAKYGKRMMFYNRMYERPEIVYQIPKDVISMYYLYAPRDSIPQIASIAGSGAALGVHPGVSNWGRFFPSYSKAVINIRDMNLEAVKNKALFSTVCNWGDGGGKNLRELCWYGYAYQGEMTWSPEISDKESFGDSYFTLRYGQGIAETFKEIYSILEKWEQILGLRRTIPPYFRHPFLPEISDGNLTWKNLDEAKNHAEKALSLIKDIHPAIKYCESDLDYLEFIALTYLNFDQSLNLVHDLKGINRKNLSEQDLEDYKIQLTDRVKVHRDELTHLRDVFEGLWLRTNLPANLQYNLNDYDRLVEVWDDVIDRIQKGQFAWDPITPARWIYHPDGFTEKDTIPDTYFRKTITMPHDVLNAHIQLIGDTHVKLYVNGKLLGEQFARHDVIARGDAIVRLYDITPYLKEGENVIAVESHNYLSSRSREPGGPRGCAGFHLYGELETKDMRRDTILSDDSWRLSTTSEEGWNDMGFNDGQWLYAETDGEPAWLVTYPDFSRDCKGFVSNR